MTTESSELYMHHSDSSNVVLASQKLNGENFNQRQRSTEITLIARNKIGFVKGTCKKDETDENLKQKWDRCDNLVMSWLLHSNEPETASSVLYCTSSAIIWKELGEGFAQSSSEGTC